MNGSKKELISNSNDSPTKLWFIYFHFFIYIITLISDKLLCKINIIPWKNLKNPQLLDPKPSWVPCRKYEYQSFSCITSHLQAIRQPLYEILHIQYYLNFYLGSMMIEQIFWTINFLYGHQWLIYYFVDCLINPLKLLPIF